MTKLNKLFLSLFVLAGMAGSAIAQTALTQTSLSAAITDPKATAIVVASATGINAPSTTLGNPATILVVDDEAMAVNSVSGTTIFVTRGYDGTKAVNHVSGSIVTVGTPSQFTEYDPDGSCTAGATVKPYINLRTGRNWLCDATTGVWLPVLSTGSITPAASSAAIQTAGQAFTLNGVISGEPLVVINQPAPTSLCPLVAARATAANQVTLYFTTLTAAACTPAAGTYMFEVPRLTIGGSGAP